MAENPYFSLQGVSHLALVCSDMARTVEFYEGMLGMPLIKTMELPAPYAGQHFFFDIGNGDCLAFFWFENGEPAAPGVAFPTTFSGVSADGSMHHIAFKIPPAELEQTRRRLDEKGVDYHFVAHALPEVVERMMARLTPEQLARVVQSGVPRQSLDDVNDDTFAASFYFTDPDGIVLEFCAWMPAYEKIGRDHEPSAVGRQRLAGATV